MKQYSGLIITLIIIIILGAIFWLAPEKEPPFGPIDVGGGSITVEDQTYVDIVALSADLAAPGFITIHSAIGDAPGPVIGTSSYLETGTHEIEIVLTEMMTPGLTYITLLHVDDGDGYFDIQKDMPVEVNGEVVRPSFVALSSGEVEE